MADVHNKKTRSYNMSKIRGKVSVFIRVVMKFVLKFNDTKTHEKKE